MRYVGWGSLLKSVRVILHLVRFTLGGQWVQMRFWVRRVGLGFLSGFELVWD